jgi:hypothetical protein
MLLQKFERREEKWARRVNIFIFKNVLGAVVMVIE